MKSYYKTVKIPVRVRYRIQVVEETRRTIFQKAWKIDRGFGRMLRGVSIGGFALLVVLGSPGLAILTAAFEAHVINVTARICTTSETRSKGFWKTHPAAYALLLPQDLGPDTISTAEEARAIFANAHASGMENMLKAQLLAMKFNMVQFGIGGYLVESEGKTIDEIVAEADDLLKQNPLPPQEVLEQMKDLLDELNNPHELRYCADGNPLPEEPEDTSTLSVTKIVCEDEALLPNWGDVKGEPPITSSTAADFLANLPEDRADDCWLEEGWFFQWAPEEVVNEFPPHPPSNSGEADAPWITFGPTDINGAATVVVPLANINPRIWVREVFKEGYFPFSVEDSTVEEQLLALDGVSAEFYCHKDVIYYDNLDFVSYPEAGGIYYCIAFNVEERQEQLEEDEEEQVSTALESGEENVVEETTELVESEELVEGVEDEIVEEEGEPGNDSSGDTELETKTEDTQDSPQNTSSEGDSEVNTGE